MVALISDHCVGDPSYFGWAIEGTVRKTKEDLNPSMEILQATKEYQSELDTLSRFGTEKLRRGYGSTVAKRDLSKTYGL